MIKKYFIKLAEEAYIDELEKISKLQDFEAMKNDAKQNYQNSIADIDVEKAYQNFFKKHKNARNYVNANAALGSVGGAAIGSIIAHDFKGGPLARILAGIAGAGAGAVGGTAIVHNALRNHVDGYGQEWDDAAEMAFKNWE